MDKIDRENAADPTTAGVDPDTGRRNIDDDVTAEVVPGSEHGEPVIISNVPEGDDTPAHIAEQDDDALEPGFILRDRFEIIELVHSGGMGRVYKALPPRRELQHPQPRGDHPVYGARQPPEPQRV